MLCERILLHLLTLKSYTMKLNLILFFSALFNIVTIYAGTTSDSQAEQFLEKSKRTISFTENKGQVRDQNWQPRQDILFSGNAGGLIYHLKADGLHYQLNKIESWKEEDFSGKRVGKQMIPNQVSSYRVDVNWIGANKNAQIIKAQELAGYDNFYNVPEGVEPALFVKSYQSITYKNIYDGIDLHFYEGEHGGIEYDFIVQPGADYKQIQLEINGGELAVTPKNELVIKTPFGDIVEGSLRVFQNDKEITSNWVVSDNRIAFEMENYNPLLSMKIDPPVRLWGTYYGGSGDEEGFGCKIDNNDNILLYGYTMSSTNISTLGSHQQIISSQNDAFVVKFNTDGNRLWGSYYGGTGVDKAYSISLDNFDNIYFVGETNSSTNISTGGSHQQTKSSGYDAFIVKFNSNGVRLWATYYGGNGTDLTYSSCVDNNSGNIYIVGSTQSSTNISSLGAHQTSYSGGSGDGFVVSFDSLGVRRWGSYYGGSFVDLVSDCKVDNLGYLILVGTTNSSTNISTPPCYQDSLFVSPGGFVLKDCFLAKFNENGTRIWGTYFNNATVVSSLHDPVLTIDSQNDIYFTMRKLIKFNSQGQKIWDTLVSTNDWINDIEYDRNNNCLYVIGSTSNLGVVSSSCPYQSNINGGSDFFIIKYDTTGNKIWDTFFGGENSDYRGSCAIDSYGDLYLTGKTESLTNISTSGSHQLNYGGGMDCFLAKFSNMIDSNEIIASYYSYIDPLDSLNLIVVNTSTGNISSYLWDFGDGNTSILQYPQHTYATVGNYQICLTVSDSNCSKTYCDSTIVSKSGGIISISVIAPVITSAENINLTDGILIYPNPTNDYVTLQLSQTDVKDYSITLMNVLGEVISVQQLTTSITKIDLPETSGIYFIKVDSGIDNKIYKVFKR
jgi:hypothetical protein